jgi:hypothetical protein
MSDNYKFEVTSEGREHFDIAMGLAFGKSYKTRKATHYKITAEHGLILCWTDGMNGAMPLPFPMDLQAATEFAWGWLRNGAEYGRQPDHDGDNKPGFRVYNEDWGHVAHAWQAFVGIQPAWMMYGK